MDVHALQTSFAADIAGVATAEALEALETKYVGRKNGLLTDAMKALKDLSGDERKSAGEALNALKNDITSQLEIKKASLASAAWAKAAESERLDVTQTPLPKSEYGHYHPVTLVQRDLENLFREMGFMVLDGPELESDYYNFTSLNIPETHPARDSQDTFYIKGHTQAQSGEAGWVMRTHTSPMQVRAMQKYGAPIAAIIPGKCFRNESTDPRHEHTLYQLEGLLVGEGITLAHMKGVLQSVATHLYGPDTKIRMRPKFYPFVEPGVNGEVTCFLCKGAGCRVCKGSGWLEVFGAGLVHPKVLEYGGVDAKKYQGFAFGLGLSRLVMLKYGIEDVRLLESGDMRFLQQF